MNPGSLIPESSAHGCAVGVTLGAGKGRGHHINSRGSQEGVRRSRYLVLEHWVVFPELEVEVRVGGDVRCRGLQKRMSGGGSHVGHTEGMQV